VRRDARPAIYTCREGCTATPVLLIAQRAITPTSPSCRPSGWGVNRRILETGGPTVAGRAPEGTQSVAGVGGAVARCPFNRR
jgi:hypothetical protein